MNRFLLICLLSLNAIGQTNRLPAINIDFDQPDVLKKAGVKNIRSFFIDSRHLMWIGTDNGLYRYDGTNITYHRHKAGDVSSIPNNTVVSIAESRDGNVWIGTIGGVAKMNPYNFKCEIYTDELHSLDRGNFDNKVWVSSAGAIYTGNSNGLYELDKSTNRFIKIWHGVAAGKTLSGYVTSVKDWQKDTLVLGTFTDIVLLHSGNFGYRRISPIKKDLLVGPLCIDEQHRLWIGTWGEGCVIGNSSLTQFRQFKWEKDKPSNVDNILSSFVEVTNASRHEMWMAGGGFLSKLVISDSDQVNIKDASIYCLTNGEKNPHDISVLTWDGNSVWTGGKSEVTKFSTGQKLFTPLSLKINGEPHNLQKFVLNGKTYLALSAWHGKEGIVFWELNNVWSKTIYSVNQVDQYGTNISAVSVDKFKRIWLASLAGTYILNEHFDIVGNLSSSKNKNDHPTSKKTNDLLISNDTVWLACYKNGIDFYDLQLHKLKHFFDGDGSGLADNLISCFYRDKKGTVWICGNKRFYKYNPASASFKKFDFSIEHTDYIPISVAELPNGHLLVATETAGLIDFDPITEKFERIADPLLGNEEAVHSVAADIEGNAWYLTDNHLVKFQPQLKKFTVFGEEDGLNVDALQLLKCFDGKEIFLADNSQVYQFSPALWKKKTGRPRVILHAVQVNDSAITAGEPLHKLDLNYDQNKVFIEFDGINYTKPEQNQYAYKLSGVDRDWIYTDRNSVSYANLSPGEYHFQVKVANYEGEWSEDYDVLIDIKPPYWKTWWFISLSVLVVAAMFYFMIRYISQRNLRERILKLEKEQAVEKERNRIARDMHDDLGSGLTKIAILSEVAKTQLNQHEKASAQLETISSSSRELVDSLQDIIWVLNPKNDSLESLAVYIREFALKFFEATDIAVQFCYPSQIPFVRLSEEQRRNIFMVVKETLNNTAKHAYCSSVTISLRMDAHFVLIEINDNGRGFKHSSVRSFANGLNNMRARTEQLNGLYEIQSKEKQGTMTRLRIPV